MAGKLNRSSLLLLLSAAIVVVSVCGLVAWNGLRTDVDHINRQTLPALIAVTDISADYRELRVQLQAMALEADPARRQALQTHLEATRQQLASGLSALRGLGLGTPALDEITAAYGDAIDNARALAMAGRGDQAHALIYSSLIPAERNLQAYVDQIREQAQMRRLALDDSLNGGGIRLLGYSLLCMTFGVVLWMAFMPAKSSALQPRGDDLLVSREIATVMYRSVSSALPASLVVSGALVAILLDHPARLLLYCWWALSLGVLAGRLVSYMRWQAVRDQDFDGARAIRNYGAGSLATAVVWAAFPFMFFAEASEVQRLAMAFVFAAMAGGGALVLAPTRRISLVYLGLLLVPQVLLFGIAGSRLDLTVSILSLGMLLMLAHSAITARQTTTSALMLSRENHRLAEEAMARREALESLNLTLEDRVRERTTQLEREVEARESYAAQLHELALHDPLTGLLNRRALAERMPEMLARVAQSGGGAQILFIDLDRFKNVNDVQGHSVGDQVLIELSRRLRRTLPKSALVARWGGDEFLVAVPTTAGLDVASAVRAAIMAPVRVRDHEVRLDASIGISLFPGQGQEVEALVQQADVAMYQVKMKGRSGARVYDDEMGEDIRRTHEMGQALREALEHDRLAIAFQPIVPVSGRGTLKMEALMRWSHPERGLISPAEFIPLAEDSGLIGKLGRWSLERACREAMRWEGQTIVAVNVSALQAMSGQLLGDVAQVLADTGLPPARLELELTESVFAHDFAAIARVFGSLRDMGVHIAIDDFGTGYSSLSYLHLLPIDGIKVDRSFVRDIDAGGEQMLRAILAMAGALHFPVVAEGVENERQRDLLCSLGVDFIQGMLYSPPLSAESACEWIRARHAGTGQEPAGASMRA